MSTNTRPRREPARRVFAEEFNQATHVFKAGDSEQSPNYALLPSGERANRVLFIGTITDKEEVGGGGLRARVSDPTGTFFIYAGQYQPEAQAALGGIEPPEYVAVVGKPEVFSPEDSDDVYVSVRAERIVTIDEAFRHVWVRDAAEQTLNRLQALNESDGEFETPDDDVYEHYGEEVVNSVSETVVTALEHLSEVLEDAPQAES